MKTHLYQPDPALTAQHLWRIPCTCGMPKANRVHQLKATSAEAREVEQRRYAERD